MSKSSHIIESDFEKWLTFKINSVNQNASTDFNKINSVNVLQQDLDSNLRETESQKFKLVINQNAPADFVTQR